jgi:hydrocephalus-inducing protein
MGCKGHATLYLINSEQLPFSYAFDKSTYDASSEVLASTGQPPVIDFEPSTGTIGPGERLPIAATFTPRLERDINMNVIVRIKNKPTNLQLNVKGEGTGLHESLQVENPDGTSVLLAPRAPNPLDLGQVLVNERCVRQVGATLMARALGYVPASNVSQSDTHLTPPPSTRCPPAPHPMASHVILPSLHHTLTP